MEERLLREGATHPCVVGGREILLCRTREGVFALDDVCPHAYARLSEGRFRRGMLVCPLHGAAFDVRDGRVLGGPSPRSLPVHRVRIREGAIEVALDSDAPEQPRA
jgi:nitrite reductase/ring-hydroxylating ferredoxin subunit